MSLSQKLAMLHSAITDTINERISDGFGVKHPNYDTKVLDLRDFKLDSNDANYSMDILFPDNRRVLYVSGSLAYDDNNNQHALNSVFESSLGPLCEALDTIGRVEQATYEVILRAVVTAYAPVLPELVDFPPGWSVTESVAGKNCRTIRLDTIYTCQAASAEQAALLATTQPPSLGLDLGDADDEDLHIHFWVDTHQKDDVRRVS